jgi:hypothetical protein
MSSVTMDINGAFTRKIDLSAPSTTMRELMANETERWRQMEQTLKTGKKSLTDRLTSLLSR